MKTRNPSSGQPNWKRSSRRLRGRVRNWNRFNPAARNPAGVRNRKHDLSSYLGDTRLALLAPAATVTLAGTAATAAFELARFTRSPPLGATLVRVAVPLAPAPPTRVAGLTLTADKLAAAGAA